MNPIGYSGKPIWQKLGIKPETRIRLVSAPEHYEQMIGLLVSQQVVKKWGSRFDPLFCY